MKMNSSEATSFVLSAIKDPAEIFKSDFQTILLSIRKSAKQFITSLRYF